MKKLGMMLVILLTAVFVKAFPSQPVTGWMGQPTESFRMTCHIIREDWRTIEAYCQDRQGRPVYNQYTRGYCEGDLANMNGHIVCTQDASLPQGSYQMSCNSCQVNYPVLYCNCEDTRGYFHSTSIYLPSCHSAEIANVDGNLVCR